MIHRRSFLGTSAAVLATTLTAPPAEGQVTADREGTTIVLRDGRRLGYALYGAAAGWPVLYFHGIPTSRIEARFFAPAAHRAGCRLIAIDRPGFGLSDFQNHRQVIDWQRDVSEFVSSPQLPADLDLSVFSVACFSSGAAYALLCAAMLPAGQVQGVGIVDGIAPLEKISGNGGMSQRAFQLAARRPRIARVAFDTSTRQIRRRPDAVLRRTSRFFSPCDGPVFFEPANARILVDSYLQTVRCGSRGVIHDMSLLARPWGFGLNHCSCPTAMWYGACDITTPPASMGRYLNRAIAHSTLTVVPGQGHLSMLNLAGDAVFQFLLDSRKM